MIDDRASFRRAAFEAAARSRQRPYAWNDPQGARWKVTADGVWRWQPSVSTFVLSGWRSAVSDQLLRLAQEKNLP